MGIIKPLLGGGNSNIFLNFHPILGEMIQFDLHIFQMGGKKPPTRNFRILLEKIHSVKATLGYFLLPNSPRRSHPLYDRNEIEGRFKLSSRYV